MFDECVTIYISSSLAVALYLKGSQPQLDVQPGCHSSVLRQEGKYCVVHPKQRDEEQGGFSQPPEGNK